MISFNGSVLKFGTSWLKSAFATIGGKSYPTVVMPDGREWLAVNLDLAWTGLSVPTSDASEASTPQAMYYDYDETTYGWNGLKRGLLYNHYAVLELEANKATLCPGWSVPTETDFDTLITAIGGTTYGDKLKSTTGWYNDRNGTDDYGFAGYPSGYFGLFFAGITQYLRFWTKTVDTEAYRAKYIQLSYISSNITTTNGLYTTQCSLRLIKDV